MGGTICGICGCCSETRNGEAGGEYPVAEIGGKGGLVGYISELVDIGAGGSGRACLGVGDTFIKTES